MFLSNRETDLLKPRKEDGKLKIIIYYRLHKGVIIAVGFEDRMLRCGDITFKEFVS